MNTLNQPALFGHLVPAHQQRTYITVNAVSRERSRGGIAHARSRAPRHFPTVWVRALRIGRNLLLALWSVSVLSIWLTLAGLYMRWL